MPDSPFSTVGDEPVEARIVSWVLGEASAFEAAELDRLCEERPELLVFRRRMRALHGLLTEAEAARPDQGWKLPPEKRRALDEVFGSEHADSTTAAAIETRVRHSRRRAWLSIAACLIFTLVALALWPGRYQAETTIEIKPSHPGISPLGSGMAEDSGASGMTAQFFGTEFERVKSRKNLEQVVENLNLDSRWGVTRENAIDRLRENVDARQIRGTDLMTIRAREKDPQLARQIANEVTRRYAESRAETGRQAAASALAELDRSVRDQEDKVEARRKVLSTIVRTKGIIYRGTDGAIAGAPADEAREDAIKRGLDAQDYDDAKREFEADQQLLQQMKLKQVGEAIALRVDPTPVEIHEPATAATPTNPLRSAFSKLSDTIQPLAQSKRSEVAMSREVPTVVTYSAGEANLLETGIPAELIEGTPVPMNVPNLARSIDGPAGSESWTGVNRRTAQREEEPADELASHVRPQSRPSAPPPPPARRPAPPGSSVARAIAATPASAAEIPAPDPGIPDPSLTLGDADDFGTGWGDASTPIGGTIAGRRSGDAAVSRNSIDAILNHPQRQRESKREEASKVEEQVPTLDQLPVLGGLFRDQAGQQDAPTQPAAPPIRTNPALTHEHTRNVDQVRRNLYTDEGNFNLGKFDDAKKEYENALRTDPTNQAARRGLEKIAAAKSDYYRAAYDHTRSELLAEVDKAWELAVPADGERSAPDESPADGRVAAQQTGMAMKLEGSENKEDFWDTARDAIASHNPLGVDLSTHTGYRSEYHFRDTGMLADDTLADVDLFLNPNDAVLTPELDRSEEEPAAPDPAMLQQETSAIEDPFSTFSLNISDASFQVARAAIRKGERPDPAGIKPEQFYNAVDYGDPAPVGDEPVAATIEQAAHPVIPGRNLLRVAIKTAAAGRSATQPLNLTLLVDQSGSMSREDRRAAIDRALAGLPALLTEHDRIQVIGFARSPRLLADGLSGTDAAKLPDLVNQTASEGGTNLDYAINLAGQVARGRMTPGAQNRIVLFTDGAANLGDADPARLAERVKTLRQQGIAFDVAGIAADDLNDQLLAELARHGNGRYYVIGKGDDDRDIARQLAGAFRPAAENVKVQVRFNPERVARYRLIGFEQDRLRTEDFRNDAVDAAELAAEEAGVAIYQIEPVPGGRGVIGEVAVRFRDTASGEMVERAWTIPHDPATPALDRASPSMQLAALATLAAEKLRGGPAAEAIDFRQLREPRATVKARFQHTRNVPDLLEMIDQLER